MPRRGDPERWRKNEYAKEHGSDDVKTKKIGDFGQYKLLNGSREPWDGAGSAPLRNLRVFMPDDCKLNIS
jgi:hypothetical protein